MRIQEFRFMHKIAFMLPAMAIALNFVPAGASRGQSIANSSNRPSLERYPDWYR
jgi:hypothetical protein